MANPAVAAKMRKLADLHLKDKEKPSGNAAVKKLVPRLRDLSENATPLDYAEDILQNLARYEQFGDGKFLRVAETYARLACVRFLNDQCPLPKARAGIQRTSQAEPFPDYYFHGAKLMRAFALLGDAL